MGRADRIIPSERNRGRADLQGLQSIAIGAALAGVGEAFAVASAAGVDRAKVRQALLGGFAASRVLEVHGERILNGNFVPGFRARLFQKDLRIAEETAADEGVAVPVTDIVASRLNAIVASGGGDMDYSAAGDLNRF
jgi:2-hydroxy-3-oxopropionate reductase